ncbi:MAG: hypothetical protein IID28_11180 [Planctomycetes bacterium]|nr:hypothetical protein [Planctomycetota bacterium]
MKNPRSTAERIRPILEAMERSIDTARRRRLHETDTPVQERPKAIDTHANANANGDGEMPRRKARPKRATPTLRHPGHPEYRAEAS